MGSDARHPCLDVFENGWELAKSIVWGGAKQLLFAFSLSARWAVYELCGGQRKCVA